MSRFGKAISSTPVNVALFVIAAILLLGSIVGGTQAALSYYSDTYVARLQASNIGVTLNENGKAVAHRDYDYDGRWNQETLEVDPNLVRLLQGDEFKNFTIGKEYNEQLTVTNSGSIAEYVRVTVNKYWEDENGNKVTTVSPDFIKLTQANNNDWFVDTDATTLERTVYYYKYLLQPGDTTSAVTDKLSIDSAIGNKVTQTETKNEDGTTTIVTKYDYNGTRFCLEATAYAVQEHNVEDAIHSAWGTNVTVNNGTLSLG